MGDSDLVAITSKVSQEDRDRLDVLADERDETRSRTIRYIIRSHFRNSVRKVPLSLSMAFSLLYIGLTVFQPENTSGLSITFGTFLISITIWSAHPWIKHQYHRFRDS